MQGYQLLLKVVPHSWLNPGMWQSCRNSRCMLAASLYALWRCNEDRHASTHNFRRRGTCVHAGQQQSEACKLTERLSPGRIRSFETAPQAAYQLEHDAWVHKINIKQQ
mmetsp:Transcript_40068/g.97298  ORF Transcript_40068/g.97298 Transcript_40068/m.97298 type:complete len:108 (-) Transcript_40068:766-1089(-)